MDCSDKFSLLRHNFSFDRARSKVDQFKSYHKKTAFKSGFLFWILDFRFSAIILCH